MAKRDAGFFWVIIGVKTIVIAVVIVLFGYWIVTNNIFGEMSANSRELDSSQQEPKMVPQNKDGNTNETQDNALNNTIQGVKDDLQKLKNASSSSGKNSTKSFATDGGPSANSATSATKTEYGFYTNDRDQDINTDNIQVAGQEASTDNTLQPTYEGGSSVDQYTGFTAPDETVYFEGGIVDGGTTDAIVNPNTNLIPSNEQVNCISGTEGCYEVLPDPIVPIIQ